MDIKDLVSAPIGTNYSVADVDMAAVDMAAVNARAGEVNRKAAQMAGIEFQGVMCSATSEDQTGLAAVDSQFSQYKLHKYVILPMKLTEAKTETEKTAIQAQIDSLSFPDIHFRWENGSCSTLNESNIDALSIVWRPFRLSFFPAN